MANFSIYGLLFLILLSACKDSNPIDGGKPPCGIIDPGIVPKPPYDSPIWHPSGQFIGFNHTPLKRITYPYGEACWGVQEFAYDSTGFWLIDPDGADMRKIFPHTLLAPAWSPDGQWIAFVAGAQIFKMRFTETKFDTTTLTQLTFAGRNFFPSWSPDGRWIAYNKSICEGPNTCGIWLITSDGTQNRFLAPYGNFPTWKPLEREILFVTRGVTESGQVFGDSLWLYDVKTSSKEFFVFLGGTNHSNRNPKYSPDGTKIAFYSQPIGKPGDLWVMNNDGTNTRQMTTESIDYKFGWGPDDRYIVYTRYHTNEWSYNNGVLWIIDMCSGKKRQLTFNHPPGQLKNKGGDVL